MDVQFNVGSSSLLMPLPEPLGEALHDYAALNRIPVEMVIEFALASFLDLDATSFQECRLTEGLGRLRERVAMLETQVAALKQGNRIALEMDISGDKLESWLDDWLSQTNVKRDELMPEG